MDSCKAIYLDYNSTTPVAPQVISTITKSLTEEWANPSSGSHLGKTAQNAILSARQLVGSMINCTYHDIIFTSGGTESNNMAINSAVEWGRNSFETPHVVLSNVEHVATSAPIKYLASKQLIEFTEVAVDMCNGCLQVGNVIESIKPNTVLVTVMMANNETGVIFPIKELGQALREINKKRERRVWFHVDAAQAVGKININVEELGVDYMTIVGHKFYGPRIGALYARRVGEEAPLSPVVQGGGQERGFRPGTENTAMIAGLGAAALIVYENLDKHSTHMRNIRDYLLQKLKEENVEFVLNCEKAERLPNTASLAFPNCKSGLELLEKCFPVIASTTAACHDQTLLSEVLLRSGVPENLARSTIRISTGRETSRNDIDETVRLIKMSLRL